MDLLKKGLVLVLVAVITMLLSMSMVMAATSFQALDAAEVEELLDALVHQQMQEFNIPNMAVSIVTGGEVILVKGYGYADLDKQIPVDPDKTLFRIASTSKLFTWTAVMQLVERGKLCLDVDVNEYLDFEIPARLAYGQRQSEPEPITLKHLMTHTPGFEDYVTGLINMSEDQMIPLNQYVRERLPARVFPPGEVIAYSNYGAALAAYIVERVSGVPFAQYVEENIYKPLGMEHSTFRQPLPEHLAGHMARAYRYVNGEFHEGRFEFVDEAGSMSSTASDMARFMLAYLQGGQLERASILEEETARKMFGQLFTHYPRLDGMAHGFIEGTYNEKHILSHGGGSLLFNTDLYLLPEEQIGIYLAHSGGNYIVHNVIFQAFMDRFFPSDGAVAPPPPPGMAERSRAFAGEYHQNRRSFTGGDKFLRLLIGQIHVVVDEEGYLLVTHMGETNKFVEIEPGVYHNLREGRTPDVYGNFRTIVFGSNPAGELMLMTDGAMSYSKAPWYETTRFNISMLALAVLFVLGSLLYWGTGAVIQKIRRKKSEQPAVASKAAKLAKWTAIAYGILTFVSVLETVVSSQPDPVYGLPPMVYGEAPAWISLFNMVPPAMAILGVAAVFFAVLAWWKAYWRIPGRIHYTLFATATVALLWFFSYWTVSI